ncbi:hypothetical protein VTN77DRAFT_2039 [Rasamsonia byssochlamydoides]|uniref:uncharacterized protein n=1 Tax=Rasamsonia byssochlamydoides TaxID=89139 RepID=UPI003742D033
MADDVNLRQEIFNKTLQEVARDDEDGSASPCVICLDSISEPGIAVPCKHANFDFLCLASWLQQSRSCPLCKIEVTAVKYDLQSPQGPKIYVLPPEPSTKPAATPTLPPSERRRPRPPRRPPQARPVDPEDPLTRRRHVYRHQLYSLRVGSNRLSQYRELTPQLFNRDEELVSRARKWIRRELQVFEFLNPDGGEDGSRERTVERGRPGEQRLASRRANNAEFLLEYIIAILRTVDIKGSAGQAEDLLQEFIGRANARLFLHELQSWLRSPYTSLQDWDRHVQYEDTVPRVVSPGGRGRDGQSTPVYPRTQSGRISKPYPSNASSSRDAQAQARRVQYARQRYQPD